MNLESIQLRAVSARARKQGGFSLLELMLVLVVLALLIFGAYVLFGSTQEGARSDQAQKNLLGLHAGVKRVCTKAGQCPTLTVAQIISSGQAPADMVNGTTLQNPWGGAVTFAVGNLGSGTNNAFVYTFADVPKAECNTFVNAVQNNFARIAVGSTTIKDVGTAYTAAGAITACNNDTSTVVFTQS